MANRFFLTIDSIQTEIAEPVGWDALAHSLERRPYHGFIEDFGEGKLTFWCGVRHGLPAGFELIQAAFDLNGPDAVVGFRSDWECGGTTYTEINGTLNLFDWGIEGNEGKCAITRTSFQQTFAGNTEQKTDLFGSTDLNGNTLPSSAPALLAGLHSKAISKQLKAENKENSFQSEYSEVFNIPNSPNPFAAPVYRSLTYYLGFGFDNTIYDELETNHSPGSGWQSIEPEYYTATEAGVHVITVDLRAYVRVDALGYFPDPDSLLLPKMEGCSEGGGAYYHIQLICEIAGVEHPLFEFSETNCNQTTFLPGAAGHIAGAGTFTATLGVLDQVKIYARMHVYGDYNMRADETNLLVELKGYTKADSFLHVTALTKTPETTARVALAHEALAANLQMITGREDPLYSDYFGRVDSFPRSYATNGCGAFTALASGQYIRRLERTKQLTYPVSFDGLIKTLQPVFAIGYGFENDPLRSVEVMRVEPYTFFYQDSEVIELSALTKFVITVAHEYIYNKVATGYQRWENEEVNGLDEINTKREYKTSINGHKNTFTQLSEGIASGYAIEFTRRMGASDKLTVDWKYDNNTFIIACRVTEETASYNSSHPNTINVPVSLISAETLANPGSVYLLLISGSAANEGSYHVFEVNEVSVGGVPNLSFTLTGGGLPDYTDNTGTVLMKVLKADRTEDFTTVSGILDPDSSYNLKLTPFFNLARWGVWLKSGVYYKSITDAYLFTYGEGNTNYNLKLSGSDCAEVINDPIFSDKSFQKEDLTPNGDSLFKPLYADFEQEEMSREDWRNIRQQLLCPDTDAANKYGYLSLIDNNTAYQVYPLNLKWEPYPDAISGKLTGRALMKA